MLMFIYIALHSFCLDSCHMTSHQTAFIWSLFIIWPEEATPWLTSSCEVARGDLTRSGRCSRGLRGLWARDPGIAPGRSRGAQPRAVACETPNSSAWTGSGTAWDSRTGQTPTTSLGIVRSILFCVKCTTHTKLLFGKLSYCNHHEVGNQNPERNQSLIVNEITINFVLERERVVLFTQCVLFSINQCFPNPGLSDLIHL